MSKGSVKLAGGGYIFLKKGKSEGLVYLKNENFLEKWEKISKIFKKIDKNGKIESKNFA